MPLQLYNAGPFPIRIYPYLDICQLKLVRLTRSPERSYGEGVLHSKYVNDDGGPSYWWRDIRVRRLQKQLEKTSLELAIRREIVDLVRFQDPDLLEHFEDFMLSRRASELHNADSILDTFARREEVRRWADRLGRGAFSFLLAGSLGAWFERPHGDWHYVLWALTGLSLLWAAHAWFWQPATYLGRREVASLRAERGDREPPPPATTTPQGQDR